MVVGKFECFFLFFLFRSLVMSLVGRERGLWSINPDAMERAIQVSIRVPSQCHPEDKALLADH